MDTGVDFIQPEFLNILFFQQKNIVVFPYVDLKHLHMLETFTIGHNIIDLESTALYNLREIIEFEANNSYSQNKSLFIIYNLDEEKVRDIIQIPGIRCILNTKDDIKSLANGSNFIFYNKKNNTFLNYDKNASDLTFERYLISSSENETVLYEKIQHIKILATKIFTEINKDPGSYDFISEILGEYDIRYWDKILDFVRFYFDIEIPILNFTRLKSVRKRDDGNTVDVQDMKFLKEYAYITKLNKYIANEFVKLLHQYRSQKVNASNLDLEQLYHPQKLYVYLRTHHWNKQIDVDFLRQLSQMKITGYILTAEDISDLGKICKVFNVPLDMLSSTSLTQQREVKKVSIPTKHIQRSPSKAKSNGMPSVKDFAEYKRYVLKRLEEIELMLKKG